MAYANSVDPDLPNILFIWTGYLFTDKHIAPDKWGIHKIFFLFHRKKHVVGTH